MLTFNRQVINSDSIEKLSQEVTKVSFELVFLSRSYRRFGDLEGDHLFFNRPLCIRCSQSTAVNVLAASVVSMMSSLRLELIGSSIKRSSSWW